MKSQRKTHLELAKKLYSKTIEHLSGDLAPNESSLFHLAKMGCQLEAARALNDLASQNPANSGLQKFADFQSAVALNQIRSKLAEAPSDYGFKSAQEIFEDEPESNAQILSSASTVEWGKSIAAAGTVPQIVLDEDHEMIRETFRKLTETAVVPLAEKIHREDLLVPEELIAQLRDLGCFGLSIPESYGGFQAQDKEDLLGMVLVTEELSRGSLAAAGSLITRPEILARALLKGGTEEQKTTWLPKVANGEKMAAIAVTEPDHGSDVAGIRVTATKDPSRDGWVINGTKTWCTFAGRADVLAVLCRTNPDMSQKHKGLSLFLVEKPSNPGHSFQFKQPQGGSIEGRAIPTIGYRGMHSFEVKFESWFVPSSSLVGGEAGLGKGFYLQMEGFAAGRLQTAARANGVMHAALEAAIRYGNDRKVFGKPVAELPASSQKFVFMTSALLAARALTYDAAQKMERPEGTAIAAMAKLYASQTAEWLTREAQQFHGGMGYAEEFAVSRYFVDARVLSIFEGAEEVLAVKVIAPALLGNGSAKGAARSSGSSSSLKQEARL